MSFPEFLWHSGWFWFSVGTVSSLVVTALICWCVRMRRHRLDPEQAALLYMAYDDTPDLENPFKNEVFMINDEFSNESGAGTTHNE